MGHRDSGTTLVYYRHQLAPVIEVGADVDFTGIGSQTAHGVTPPPDRTPPQT